MKITRFVILAVLFSSVVFSQQTDRIKVSGGLIIPSVSTKGFTGNVEFEHKMSDRFSVYFYSGIYSWDRNQLDYLAYDGIVSGYNEDSHMLIPVYGGMKIMISKIATFTIFGDFELGYNYLTYNEYNTTFIYDETDKHNNKLVTITTDASHPKKISTGLFGFGVGLGVTQTINQNVALLVEVKRNSLIKSSDNWLTHYYLNAGIVFGI